MFIGRRSEFEQLKAAVDRDVATFVVCKGRRRIGKSRLIEELGQSVKQFYSFQGLAPFQGATEQDQLRVFSEQLAANFSLPEIVPPGNWAQAFTLLAQYVQKNRVVLFLDEISWMSHGDPGFAGKLKIAWDTLFKRNPKLTLVICGSVSSWIDENILNSAGFVGRVSLTITLKELLLHHCQEFWGKQKKHVSTHEKLKILSVMGGVPRYLEEIKPKQSAEQNIKDLCFTESGFLFNEFDKIFRDIFQRRASLYRDIVLTLVTGHKTFLEVCQTLKRDPNGVMSAYLDDLVESGFLAKDHIYKIGGKPSKFYHYRLKDNYLRFYLRYIYPHKDKIRSGLYAVKSLENLSGWKTIMGLQFENLILNNLPLICHLLKIPLDTLVSASPYFQKKTKRQQACQIDLMIQTQNTVYVCEIKFVKKLSTKVTADMQRKIQYLKIPKTVSVRPVLIYSGELSEELEADNYWSHRIPADELFSDVGL